MRIQKSENMQSVQSLKEKARMVFKGLDDYDYAILRFYCEKGATSKYEAYRYFDKEADTRIPRATVYRKIQNLKKKGFLKVVGIKKFERGKLKSDVEILSVETVKGSFAVLGSGVNPLIVFEEPPEEIKRMSAMISKFGSKECQIDFYNQILDCLIEVNEDLTEKKGDLNILYFMNTLLLIKRPDYMSRLLKQAYWKENSKKAIREFLKLQKAFQKSLTNKTAKDSVKT